MAAARTHPTSAGRRGLGVRLWVGLLRWLLCLAVPALALGGAHAALIELDAQAQSFDLAGRVDVLADPGGRLTIEEVRAAALAGAFRPSAGSSGDLNFGYTRNAYWLRFQVRLAGISPSDDPAPWRLEVGYPSLDRVEFYRDDAREPLIAGDHQPFADRPVAHRNLVFPLPLRPGETATVLLRVRSDGSLTVPLRLWESHALSAHDYRSYTVLALYYGALLALLLYNLLLYLAIRDRSYLEYVLFAMGMAIGQLSLNGFGNQFLWPEATSWGNLALPVGFALCGLFAARFTRSFLDTHHNVPRLDVLLYASAWGFGALAAGLLLMPYRHGAALVSALGLTFSLLAVVCGLRCRQLKVPGASWYLLAWSLVLAGTAIFGARSHGWLPTNAFTSYAMQFGSALEMLLLSFALAERINTLRHERASAQAEAFAANLRLLEALQQSKETLTEEVTARTRELEATNRRLVASEQRLRHLAHHDALTGLPNRILLTDRLAQAIARARRNRGRTAVLLIDLDNFKPVNDRYGHATGDMLLTGVAGRLQASVRAGDTVARLGGDEFVVVLEAAGSPEDVQDVCAAIVKALCHPFQLGEWTVVIGASVGVALFPDDGQNASSLLSFADKAMYRRKEERHGHRPAPERERVAQPAADTPDAC